MVRIVRNLVVEFNMHLAGIIETVRSINLKKASGWMNDVLYDRVEAERNWRGMQFSGCSSIINGKWIGFST